MKNNSWILALVSLLIPFNSVEAGIVFSFTNASRTLFIPPPVAGSIADANAVGGATSYAGVWFDDNPLMGGRNGIWSLDIEFNSSVASDVLKWGSSGFTSKTVPIGAGGAGLALEFDTDPSILRPGALTMDFSVSGRGPWSVNGVTYSVGVPALPASPPNPFTSPFPATLGSTADSDWGSTTVNSGGTLTPDTVANTFGGENPSYISTTGLLTPTNNDSEIQDWYISWAAGTTITWDGGVNDVDTHVFGFSGLSLATVPEPSSITVLYLGLGGFLLRRRRYAPTRQRSMCSSLLFNWSDRNYHSQRPTIQIPNKGVGKRCLARNSN